MSERAKRSRRWPLRAITIEWDHVSDRSAYPYSLAAIRGLTTFEFPAPVTFLTGDNADVESVQLTKSFLDDPERFLRHLLADE